MVTGVHERALIWDDFELCQRKREKIDMEVIRARGKMNHEMILIRQFQSTLDGSYIIRLQTATHLTQERMGELQFDELEDCQDYYNKAIRAFGFTEVSPVLDGLDDFFDRGTDELDDFFSDNDLENFFGDEEETDSLDSFFDDDPDDDDLDSFFEDTQPIVSRKKISTSRRKF